MCTLVLAVCIVLVISLCLVAAFAPVAKVAAAVTATVVAVAGAAVVALAPTAEPVPAGMGVIVAAHNGTCSAWQWQGKVYTAAHCGYQSSDWRDNSFAVDHQKEALWSIPEDLADIGQECSPDLRWWGATTGRVLPVQDVKFYAVKRGTNVWDLGEQVPAWTAGAQICFEQSLYNRFADGDSGGPLLAGDEPVGSVSWSSNMLNGMACFGRLEQQPVWGGYVPTSSSKEGKGFRMKSISTTDSLAVALTQVFTDLAIVALCLMAAFFLARIRASFRNPAGNNTSATKEPVMGIENLTAMVRHMANVIARIPALMGTAILQQIVEVFSLGVKLQALFSRVIMARTAENWAKAKTLAKKNNWAKVRFMRYLRKMGITLTLKPLAKLVAKAPAKPAVKPVKVVPFVDPFTTCKNCNNDFISTTGADECGRCKMEDAWIAQMMEDDAAAIARDEADLQEHLQVLAAQERQHTCDIQDECWCNTPSRTCNCGHEMPVNSVCITCETTEYGVEALSVGLGLFFGQMPEMGSALTILTAVAVIASLALFTWATSEEKKGNSDVTGGVFCLYSTPIRHTTTGAWTAITDNTDNNTGESAPVASGESQEEKPMSFINKMNQTIQGLWSELARREKKVKATVKPVSTYGSILAASKVEHTALTRICGPGIRSMVIRELSKKELRELDGQYVRETETHVIIVRDSQEFTFERKHLVTLLSAVEIAGHATDKKVTEQEVNKYFGSLLWAPAEVVQFHPEMAELMSAEVAKHYDGTNIASAVMANPMDWVGYAIRRLLTVSGLYKGMFIVMHAGYFPNGVHLLASELKPHLRLKKDTGRALGLQPQGNGHSDVANTLGLQLWAMLLGPWVASVGFAKLAADAYSNAVNGLGKANERLLAPSEEGEDGRDALLAEASRQHGFNPIAVFRSFATSLANGLTKAFDPKKVNIAPMTKQGKAMVPNGYPMMLPWLALAELWLRKTGSVPKELADLLAETAIAQARLFKLANGAIPVLVRNLDKLDAATINGIRQTMIAAIATRIPTGKTSGIEVMLFDAEAFGKGLIPEIVGRKKNDIEFWLFPCDETTAFKVASEGGDDDDLYEFLTGTLHKMARQGIEWRMNLLDMSEAQVAANAEMLKRFGRSVAGIRDNKATMAKLMAMPFATVTTNGKTRAGWPALFGVKMGAKGWQVGYTEPVEDVIAMNPSSRDSVTAQVSLFGRVMAANNESPFSAAIGTVAQSHKFALGILAGHIILPENISKEDARTWALFVIATILLSDMVDACNKGKGYQQAAVALRQLNWAWGWLCLGIARGDGKIICPVQYLVTVPPAARELFYARHATTTVVNGNTVQPGKMLASLFEEHDKLGAAVELFARDEHNRGEFAATVTAMLETVSVPVPGAVSAQAMGSEVWAEVWTASGRKKTYLDGLKIKAAMFFADIRDEQRYMAELNNTTVYAAHAEFDRIAMTRLMEAAPNAGEHEIAAMLKLAKLGMVYSYAFKTVGYEENCIKILMDEEGEFGASGGVPTYIVPTTGTCTFIGDFAGNSEVLIEWMTAPATLARIAEIKAESGDFKYVVLSMKGEAFGEMIDGGRDLTYTEADFNGKSIIEILCMPGVALAGNQREESHVDQSTWLASVADTVTQRRNDVLRRLKAENKAAEALLRGKTFGELLQEFNVSVVAESVTGTATVEKIEAFNWSEKKHQGRTYPNTFVIVRFNNEAGPVTEETEEDEITIIVGDEVTEVTAPAPDTKENVTIEVPAAAAPVVAVPMTAEEKKQDMGNKLNRIFGKKEAEKSAAPAEVVAAPVEAEKLKILAVTEAPIEKEGYSQTVERKLKPRVFGKTVKETLALGWNFRFAKDQHDGWLVVDTRFGISLASGRTQKEAQETAVRGLQTMRDRNSYSDVGLSNALFEIAMKMASPLDYLIWLKDQPPIGSTPLVTPAPAVTVAIEAEKPTHRCVGNFALSGLQYSDAKDVAERELVEGAEITLVRNVAHPKDANAVEVHVNGYRFGYVPKETAEKLAPRMDIGVKAWAVITGWEHGYPRFDLFLGRTPTAMETFNFQRDKIDDACDRLMWLEAWDATPEQKSRAEATLAHFAALCGSIKL